MYALVRRIPPGRVVTYGQVAALAQMPGRPRQVGYALSALPVGSPIPWQRVINAKGQIVPLPKDIKGLPAPAKAPPPPEPQVNPEIPSD